MPSHSALTAIHRIENWSFANAAARLANGQYVSTDIGKASFQQDNGTYWRLNAVATPGPTATPTWIAVGSAVGNVIENGTTITSISGAESTSLKNKDVTGLTFGYLIAVTIADATSTWQYQNGAPDATKGDAAITGQANQRWRKTGGY